MCKHQVWIGLHEYFSDNGRNSPFSAILWPPQGQNLANLAKKQINFERWPFSVHTKFDLHKYVFRSEATILTHFKWPLDGRNWVKITKS